MSVVRKLLCPALCLLVLTAIGCNQEEGVKLVPAGGVVKFKGEPVSGASVSLIFTDKNVAAGTTDAEGKFELFTNARRGAPVGHAKISVKKVSGSYAGAAGAQGGMSPKEMTAMMQKQGTAGQMKTNPSGAQDELPAKYGNPDTSGLEVDIPEKGLTDMELSLTE